MLFRDLRLIWVCSLCRENTAKKLLEFALILRSRYILLNKRITLK